MKERRRFMLVVEENDHRRVGIDMRLRRLVLAVLPALGVRLVELREITSSQGADSVAGLAGHLKPDLSLNSK